VGFRLIRDNPEAHIERLMEFSEAAHHIDYFNIRRTEMLPPNFAEARNGEYIRIHEVDNFIELELHLNKKLRSSLKGEAGDLIDDATNISYDTMGLGHTSISEWTVDGINSVDDKILGFNKAITKHFKKTNKIPPLGYVTIDYKYFEEISMA